MKRHLPTTLAVSIGLLLTAAQAQAGRTLTLTYSLGAAVTHDANLFRLAPSVDPLTAIGSSDKSDTLTTTSIGVVADKELGIQRLKLDMQLGKSRYRQFRRLDNDHYQISATWHWALGRRLHGDLTSSRKTSLTGFDDSGLTTRNMNTLTTRSGSAYLQLAPDWDLFGVLSTNESANSAADRQAAGYVSHGTELGLRHSSPNGHQFTLRRRQGRSAVVRQEDVEASGTWAFSGISRLSGGLGRSRRQTEGVATSDSSGATGRLALDWTPSAKTQLNLAARQEISPAPNNYSTNTVVRGIALGAAWAPTAKTALQLSLDQSTRSYGADPTIGAAPREDRMRNTGLTFSYRPDSTLSLNLSLRDEARDSTLAQFTYRDRLATAAVQFAF
ncbi:MAG: hypothetical protein FD157_4117 [Rhodocyclaceae bacterium]|nr:MAG: hypothetical protein FD157_4117 [Rhodocyclaceae bacterium]TNC97257.1 MAG: hypothetical protein FD118_4129 [Rhodocyclaceae bacterium]